MRSRDRLAITLAASCVAFSATASAQIGATTQGPVPEQTPSQTSAPRLTQFVQADYPPDALAQGIEGSVLLQLTIDTEGHVSAAEVVNGLGHGLDEAALAAARRFVFEPARRDGQLVPAMLRYRYRFSAAAARAAQRQPVRAALRGVLRGNADAPVAGATVSAVLGGGQRREVTTDAEGAFRFDLDAEGVVRIVARAAGFRDYEVSETVRDRDDLSVTYRLTAIPTAAPTPQTARPGDDEAGEATVRARRPAREVTRQTLEFREILRMPGTGGDALRAVQNFPGVARAINGLLIVRGSTPQDTQIFADGTLIPIVYHFGGLSSVISTELLDHIDFYPGNYSARYGRAQGGIVDVGLRGPRREG